MLECLLDLLDSNICLGPVVHGRNNDAIRALADGIDDFIIFVDLEPSLESLDHSGFLIVSISLVEFDERLGYFPLLIHYFDY